MSVENLLYIAIVIYSIILHEMAHGYAALICGDNTAKRAGRLTLNPLPHLDPIGSVALPILAVISGFGVFGWAKPVPIDPSFLNTRVKEIFVSAAGVVTNILLSFLFLMLLKFNVAASYQGLFIKIAVVNLGLGIFNLLPFPPFDGLQILRAIFPKLKHLATELEYKPAAMLVSILIAMYVFNLFFSPLVKYIFALVLG